MPTWLLVALLVTVLAWPFFGIVRSFVRSRFDASAALELSPDVDVPAGVGLLEGPTHEALTACGFRAEHSGARYQNQGVKEGWVRSWVSPEESIRAFTVTILDPGGGQADAHVLTLWTDLADEEDQLAVSTTNFPLPGAFPHDADPTDDLRYPDASPRMLVRLHRARIEGRSVGAQLGMRDQVLAGDRMALQLSERSGHLAVGADGRYRFTAKGFWYAFRTHLPWAVKRTNAADRLRAEAILADLPPSTGDC